MVSDAERSEPVAGAVCSQAISLHFWKRQERDVGCQSLGRLMRQSVS